MPRPHRVDYEFAWHHVMNRGVARQSIFPTESDRQLFLDLIVQSFTPRGVEVHGYCLMDNHFHILVRSRDAALSKAMQWFASRYTQRINYRDGRDGPIFSGRYTSVGITSEAHLVNVSRYIHLNPVQASLVADPQLWSWSSAAAYLDPRRRPPWLITADILAMFQDRAPGGDYASFLRDGVDEATARQYATVQS